NARVALSTQCVIQHYADEDRQTSPVVVQEGVEAHQWLAAAGRVELPGEAGGGRQQAEVEVQAQLEARAGQQQAQQCQPLQAGDDQTVGVAEQDGGGFHPDLQVVLTVGHGVIGVVGHGPQQVGNVQ